MKKITRGIDDKIVQVDWLKDGKLHRTNGPAAVRYYSDGTVSVEEYFQNGERYREDGPTFVAYHPNGKPSAKLWHQKNSQWSVHREDGPAVLLYNDRGDLISEIWYFNNRPGYPEWIACWVEPDQSKINN